MLHLRSRFGVFRCHLCRRRLQTVVRVSSTLSGRVEAASVPVGNGNVKLDIFHPVEHTSGRRSFLLHFPAGSNVLPLSRSEARSETIQSLLPSCFPSATLISIYYRLATPSNALSAAAAEVLNYPQPIHDTSVAFSHIIDEIIPSLFPSSRKSSSQWPPALEPRVVLLGSHIGAALATMLALTYPNDIHSVAIANPLVDWVILDELLRPTHTPPGAPRAKYSSPATSAEDTDAIKLAAKRLIDLRSKLFGSPSAYFDPFASPTLFLRAPGRDTPRTHAEALGMLDDETSFNEETEADEDWEAIGEKDESSQVTLKKQSSTGNRNDLDNLNVDTDALSSKSASNDPSSLQEDIDTITEAIGADSFGPYDDDHPPKPTRSHSSSDTSSPAPPLDDPTRSPTRPSSESRAKRVKRRKVLRSWPPVLHPEDVLLPYFNVFVSPPSPPSLPNSVFPGNTGDKAVDVGMDALLRIQGTELADLLRRACFHGREKGFGEERVKLTGFEGAGEEEFGKEEARMRVMLTWLRQRMEEQ